MTLTSEHLAQLDGLRKWATIQGKTPAVVKPEVRAAYNKLREEIKRKQSGEELTSGPEGSAPGNDTGLGPGSSRRITGPILPSPQKGSEEHPDK